MGHHQGTPILASLRHLLRALTQPRVFRITRWARMVACCPACQVEPGIPCHDNGRALTDIHPRRIKEAKETCA
ncbi:zinc finger domain-containing protein [Streptomyces hirsutus]|uniref:zinc finger domain-containing protein n=1 Tax=Streptomyces hirsutus TaxID=35620 RepID=UPI00369F8654